METFSRLLPLTIGLAFIAAGLNGCATTTATLKADGQRAIDCLHDVEPAALQAAQARIVAIVASGTTKDAAVAGVEAYAIDEIPAAVGCAAFALSISSQATASAVAAQYIATHNLSFTVTPPAQ